MLLEDAKEARAEAQIAQQDEEKARHSAEAAAANEQKNRIKAQKSEKAERKLRKQLERFFLTPTTPDGLRRRQFKAIDVESGEMVGQLGFSRIWDRTSAGHVGPVIVDPNRRSAGIGRKAIKQLIQIGFEEEHLHRIELVVFSFNTGAINCYEQAGFQTEGLMRDIVNVNGEYWHWTVMSILDHQWQSRR